MKSLQLGKPLEVDIELSDPVPTDAETEADFKAVMNVTNISAEDIKRLKAVGVHVKRQGVLETQRGVLFVTQAWLLEAAGEIGRLLRKEGKSDKPDTATICRLGDLFSKLAGKQAELSAVMLSHEPKGANGHESPPPPPNTAFPAGAVVIGGNAHAHFHQSPPDKAVDAPSLDVKQAS